MVNWRGPFTTREQATDPARADTPVYEPPIYAVPQHGAYSAPSLNSGSPFNDEFGWGPTLHTSTTDVPSAQRLGTIPRYDRYPDPTQDSAHLSLYLKEDADKKARHSVETVDADGWNERKGVFPTDRRWEDNPRRNPPPESRKTQLMAPTTYSFTRPFDTGYVRTFNGTHFSMADHRRDYPILGMGPVKSSRNTYRIEPTPWDVDVVDLPPPSNGPNNGRIRSVELPPSSRSGRLM